MRIGYDTPLDLTPLYDLLKLTNGDSENAALGRTMATLQASLKQAEQSCRAAMNTTKIAQEAKALQKGHPWFGKQVLFAPQPVFKVLISDGKPVLQGIWDYVV